MTKHEILELLKDEEIKKAIREIINGGGGIEAICRILDETSSEPSQSPQIIGNA